LQPGCASSRTVTEGAVSGGPSLRFYTARSADSSTGHPPLSTVTAVCQPPSAGGAGSVAAGGPGHERAGCGWLVPIRPSFHSLPHLSTVHLSAGSGNPPLSTSATVTEAGENAAETGRTRRKRSLIHRRGYWVNKQRAPSARWPTVKDYKADAGVLSFRWMDFFGPLP
jgi:hypothetical protein